MKNKTLALIAGISIIAVGCSNKTNDTNNTSNKSTEISKFITEEQVKEIVLAEIQNGEIIKIYLDENDVVPNYDVSVTDGKTKYEYEIDASTGKVLEKESEIENEIIDEKKLIGEEKAKSIALDKVANGKVIEISLDKDDNIVNYDITISDGEYEYEYEVNAKDGNIIVESKEIIKK